MEFESLTESTEKGFEVKLLASTLAHEIRNPLQAIRIQLDLAKRGHTKVEDLITQVATSIGRVEQVVDRVHQLSQRYRLHTQTINLHELVNSALSSVRFWLSASGIEVFESTSWEGDPLCFGDKDLLEQVILNLVMNAIQAMPQGGRLGIRISETISEAIIEISDSGEGMSEEMQSLVGTPFFTTKEGGNGLGVSFCRTIAALHGGGLDFESKLGEGTRVSLRIKKSVSREKEGS